MPICKPVDISYGAELSQRANIAVCIKEDIEGESYNHILMQYGDDNEFHINENSYDDDYAIKEFDTVEDAEKVLAELKRNDYLTYFLKHTFAKYIRQRFIKCHCIFIKNLPKEKTIYINTNGDVVMKDVTFSSRIDETEIEHKTLTLEFYASDKFNIAVDKIINEIWEEFKIETIVLKPTKKCFSVNTLSKLLDQLKASGCGHYQICQLEVFSPYDHISDLLRNEYDRESAQTDFIWVDKYKRTVLFQHGGENV